MSRHLVLVGLLFVGFGLVACGGDDPASQRPSGPSAPAGEVMVQGVAFRPRETTVQAGDQATWTFDDGGLAHTVTADDGLFDSGDRAEGQFSWKFEKAGEFSYHCERHAAMHGVVVVEEAGR